MLGVGTSGGGSRQQKEAHQGDHKETDGTGGESGSDGDVVAPTWLANLLSIVGVVIYKHKFHFRKQFSMVLFNELKWQLRDLQEEQIKQKERDRKRRVPVVDSPKGGGTGSSNAAIASSFATSGTLATSSSPTQPSLFQSGD